MIQPIEGFVSYSRPNIGAENPWTGALSQIRQGYESYLRSRGANLPIDPPPKSGLDMAVLLPVGIAGLALYLIMR